MWELAIEFGGSGDIVLKTYDLRFSNCGQSFRFLQLAKN